MTVLAAAGRPPSWRIFEKALLIAVVLDLALGGNGYLIKIGQFRLREILYMLCMGWVALRLTRINPVRLDAKLLAWCALFAAVTAFDTALGYFSDNRPGEIVSELKPLSYFPMLLFFRVAIRARSDLTLIAALLAVSGTLLATIYLLLLAAAGMGLVEHSSIFELLRVSDEFIFRHNPTDFNQPFVGFFYKGMFYVCIASLFLIFDPFRTTKILAAITVVAIAMTLTRGLCLATAICIVAGIALGRDWKRAPLLLGQCGLLLAVLFLAQQAENRLETKAGANLGQTVRSGESVRPGAANPKDENPSPTDNSVAGGCGSGSSCPDFRPSHQNLERTGDNDRAEDIKSFVREVDFSMVAIGRGLGAALRGRERIEMNYLEVLYKQGIPGLSLWLLLFLYSCQLYLAVPLETKAFGLPFFLSGLFVFISTASNTFLTGSIGMGAVFISITSLLVLTQEVPHPMAAPAWYGNWLGRKLRV